jgi:hypothetical protein
MILKFIHYFVNYKVFNLITTFSKIITVFSTSENFGRTEKTNLNGNVEEIGTIKTKVFNFDIYYYRRQNPTNMKLSNVLEICYDKLKSEEKKWR